MAAEVAALRPTQESSRDIADRVAAILADVRARGDAGVAAATARFDWPEATPSAIAVPPADLDAAYAEVAPELLEALRTARDNCTFFHRHELRPDWEDVGPQGQTLGIRHLPVDRAGLYVPGGLGAYASTVIMNSVPALVAGVRELVICTPPGRDGSVNRSVLAAARLMGVEQGVPRGRGAGHRRHGLRDRDGASGGRHLRARQRLRDGSQAAGVRQCGHRQPGRSQRGAGGGRLDGPAGVDRRRHARPGGARERGGGPAGGRDARAVRGGRAGGGRPCGGARRRGAGRGDRGAQAGADGAPSWAPGASGPSTRLRARTSSSWPTALVNEYAPEHLEIQVADPRAFLAGVRSAGAIFLGHGTPTAFGDYIAGSNHVLPTGGSARFSSPLSVDTFMRKSSFVEMPADAARRLTPRLARVADSEGFWFHRRSAELRTEDR